MHCSGHERWRYAMTVFELLCRPVLGGFLGVLVGAFWPTEGLTWTQSGRCRGLRLRGGWPGGTDPLRPRRVLREMGVASPALVVAGLGAVATVFDSPGSRSGTVSDPDSVIPWPGRGGAALSNGCSARFSVPARPRFRGGGAAPSSRSCAYSLSRYWIFRALMPSTSAAREVEPPPSPACGGWPRARSRASVAPGMRPMRPVGRGRGPAHRRREVVGRQLGALRQHHRALDRVLQLAHVARPVVAEQRLQRARARARCIVLAVGRLRTSR